MFFGRGANEKGKKLTWRRRKGRALPQAVTSAGGYCLCGVEKLSEAIAQRISIRLANSARVVWAYPSGPAFRRASLSKASSVAISSVAETVTGSASTRHCVIM